MLSTRWATVAPWLLITFDLKENNSVKVLTVNVAALTWMSAHCCVWVYMYPSPVETDWPLSALRSASPDLCPLPVCLSPSLHVALISCIPTVVSLLSPSCIVPPPTKTIPLSFPTLTSKDKTLEGALERPALECQCVIMALCVLYKAVLVYGVVCSLLDFLWGDDEAGGWGAGCCILAERIWHHKPGGYSGCDSLVVSWE